MMCDTVRTIGGKSCVGGSTLVPFGPRLDGVVYTWRPYRPHETYVSGWYGGELDKKGSDHCIHRRWFTNVVFFTTLWFTDKKDK